MKKIIAILLTPFFIYSHAAYAVFDFAAEIESVLEYKKEIERKIEEIQKKIRDTETRARQGFEQGLNCFKKLGGCDPSQLKDFLAYMTKEVETGRRRVHTDWGFTLGGMDSPECKNQDGLLKDIQRSYTYNRGQGQDISRLQEQRAELNKVIINEIALMFAKGATTHNDLQKEKDNEMYLFKFENKNMDEILYAQSRVALATAARLARILEFRSNIISTAATAEMTLQNQENLEK